MFEPYLHVIPNTMPMPEYDILPETGWGDVKAMKYEGIPYKGKKTEIFAYYGYPKEADSGKVPAVVLVHGGGGHAYADWVKHWNDQGFAAIAMDLRGALPLASMKGTVGTETQRDDCFEPMPCADGYTPMPDGYCIYDEAVPIRDVWFYQAIANVILAHNILRQDPKIDLEKIGISGVSWGGNITSQVIAYDRRFAFAIPIYGSANLHLSLSDVGKPFTELPAARMWNTAEKYQHIPFPILWLCCSYDKAFDILPNSVSYLQTKQAGAVLTVLPTNLHGHVHGWGLPEGYRFARSVIFGEPSLVKPITEPQGFGEVSFEITDGQGVSAVLYYLTKPMAYGEDSIPDYEWSTLTCTVTGNTVSVRIPEGTDNYYIELTQKDGDVAYTTATSYVYRNSQL